MLEQETEIVVELAKGLASFLRAASPTWSAGYYRFYMAPGQHGANGSFADASGVELIDALEHRAFYNGMRELSLALFESLGQDQGVALLVMKSDYSYEIKFDFDDPEQWEITKLNGASGLPRDKNAN